MVKHMARLTCRYAYQQSTAKAQKNHLWGNTRTWKCQSHLKYKNSVSLPRQINLYLWSRIWRCRQAHFNELSSTIIFLIVCCVPVFRNSNKFVFQADKTFAPHNQCQVFDFGDPKCPNLAVCFIDATDFENGKAVVACQPGYELMKNIVETELACQWNGDWVATERSLPVVEGNKSIK